MGYRCILTCSADACKRTRVSYEGGYIRDTDDGDIINGLMCANDGYACNPGERLV